MARYRIFKRRWCADKAKTIPKPGRKYYLPETYYSEEKAQEACRAMNTADFGAPSARGPYGAAWEYESF